MNERDKTAQMMQDSSGQHWGTEAHFQRFADLVRAAEREVLAQPEQEPVAYAGVKVWVGNQQVVQLLTQTELHYAVDPWLLVELSALKCVKAMKELNT